MEFKKEENTMNLKNEFRKLFQSNNNEKATMNSEHSSQVESGSNEKKNEPKMEKE